MNVIPDITQAEVEDFIANLESPVIRELFRKVDEFVMHAEDTSSDDFQVAASMRQGAMDYIRYMLVK